MVFFYGITNLMVYNAYPFLNILFPQSLACFWNSFETLLAVNSEINLLRNTNDYRGYYILGEAYIAKENVNGAIEQFTLRLKKVGRRVLFRGQTW